MCTLTEIIDNFLKHFDTIFLEMQLQILRCNTFVASQKLDPIEGGGGKPPQGDSSIFYMLMKYIIYIYSFKNTKLWLTFYLLHETEIQLLFMHIMLLDELNRFFFFVFQKTIIELCKPLVNSFKLSFLLLILISSKIS